MSDTSYHLAIDIGVSGGTVNGALELEKVQRFVNAPVKRGYTLGI